VNDKCPEIPHTRNLNGSIGLRLLVSESINSATSAVRFIFSRRWAGRTSMGIWRWEAIRITGFARRMLLLLQQSFEHSIWGPFGFQFMTGRGTGGDDAGGFGI